MKDDDKVEGCVAAALLLMIFAAFGLILYMIGNQ